ncbi:MAG TPA: type VI secretion system-associated FHA domain protein TagH, partial [Burkholderiaceae bacterium]|nr:type VI secretion system-associated FHA domain protein TagH [Burkholderiaceae bacterium]
DPERKISRKQALITCRAGRHFICPIGTNVPVEVNGVPLAPDVESELALGAEIRIGPYLLCVEEEEVSVAPSPAAPAAAPRPPPPAAQPEPQPDTLDPMAAFGARKDSARGAFDDLLASPAPAQPKAPPAAPVKAAPPTLPRQDKPSRAAARANPAAGHAAPAAPKAAKDSAPQRAHAADELIAALFHGLGAPAPGPAVRSPEQMRLIGEMLRAAIAGTLQLLAARTIAKRELGASATMLQTRENNPLKFSPDADAALAHLLGPPELGFIAPLAAVRDAFSDLRAHQVAVLAGMRAALDEVLARFDPEVLEQRLSHSALLDKFVPVNRKAKLWENYSAAYAEIMREVEDDFDTLFGRAFLQAYQAQLAELARAGETDPADEV